MSRVDCFPRGTICLEKSVPQSVWLNLNTPFVCIILLILRKLLLPISFFSVLLISSRCLSSFLKAVCTGWSCVHAEFCALYFFTDFSCSLLHFLLVRFLMF